MNVLTFLQRAMTDRSHSAAQLRMLLRWLVLGALVAAVMLLSVPESAFAQDAAPTPARVNPLKVGTLLEFDPRKTTVGDALASVLEPVRYRITERTVDPLVSAAVLRRPLPPIAANAGVMSIEAAALLLIGEEHRLVVDHANRFVAIERHVTDDIQER